MTNLQHWLYFEKVLRYLVLDHFISVCDGYDHNVTVNSHTFHYRDWDDKFSFTLSDEDGYTIDEITNDNYLELYEWLDQILNRR